MTQLVIASTWVHLTDRIVTEVRIQLNGIKNFVLLQEVSCVLSQERVYFLDVVLLSQLHRQVPLGKLKSHDTENQTAYTRVCTYLVERDTAVDGFFDKVGFSEG